MAHPGSSGVAAPRWLSTRFHDTRDVAMSRQNGSSASMGAVKQIGLVPKNARRARYGATSASALVNAKAMWPRRDAWRAKYAAAPKWVECATATTPVPVSWASSSASAIATLPE